jgi:hypothetical protein
MKTMLGSKITIKILENSPPFYYVVCVLARHQKVALAATVIESDLCRYVEAEEKAWTTG